MKDNRSDEEGVRRADLKNKSVKWIFDNLYICRKDDNPVTDKIILVVYDNSKGFQKDIADKCLLNENYRLSEKQAWCLAYEFKRLYN